ncbi:hypothetical protein [Caballeronia sp. LjRoot31]|jgi:hypothetical protein
MTVLLIVLAFITGGCFGFIVHAILAAGTPLDMGEHRTEANTQCRT